ncbi:uncharacterized protein RJT20DRAFT_129931 [Scheffersomyces xylosifermentans]|uniref:uncharacterized protein n=1 Tax=Scheffersomyces xylosifermentans TaxID=1304137 RepID=UPI00315DD4BB
MTMRNRKVLVCANCKRRKIKCDRGSPCSGCQINGIRCEYLSENRPQRSEDRVSKRKEVEVEIGRLKAKLESLERSIGIPIKSDKYSIWSYHPSDFDSRCLGVNPCLQNGKFLAHSQYDSLTSVGTSSHRYYGPLSWTSLVFSDPALYPNLTYRFGEVTRLQTLPSNLQESALFAEKINSEPLVNEQLQLQAKTRSTSLLEKALSIGVPIAAVNHQGIDLTQKARLLLPTRDVVWALIDRFFRNVYGLLPLVDQVEFETWAVRVIGADRSRTTVDKLNLESQMDVATLGLFLLILRLSYLSTFLATSGSQDDNSPETAIVRKDAIPIDVFEVAKLCLQKFDYLRMCNFKIVQLILFMKIYYIYAPELGHTPEDTGSQSLTALLVKMAMSVGLHRDVDYMNKQDLDKKQINLRRRIWYFIIYLDLQGGINNGLPLSISIDDFDTKVPSMEPGNDNSKYDSTERSIPKLISVFHNLFNSFSGELQRIASLRKNIMAQNMCTSLSTWETHIMSEYKLPLEQDKILSLEEYYQTIAYLESRTLLSTIMFRIYLHYEKSNVDFMYYYIKKLILYVIVDMVKICEDMNKNMDTWFSIVPDLFIIPPLESYLHRGIVILQSVLFRCRFSILDYQTSPNHDISMESDTEYAERYKLLLRTFDLTDKLFDIIIGGFYKLSRRYYYSWRCSLAQQTLEKARNGTDYYLEWCKGSETYLKFSSEMLVDFNTALSSILEDSNRRRGRSASNETSTEWESFEQNLNDIGDFWTQIMDNQEIFNQELKGNSW